jgi:hypothetical protein
MSRSAYCTTSYVQTEAALCLLALGNLPRHLLTIRIRAGAIGRPSLATAGMAARDQPDVRASTLKDDMSTTCSHAVPAGHPADSVWYVCDGYHGEETSVYVMRNITLGEGLRDVA